MSISEELIAVSSLVGSRNVVASKISDEILNAAYAVVTGDDLGGKEWKRLSDRHIKELGTWWQDDMFWAAVEHIGWGRCESCYDIDWKRDDLLARWTYRNAIGFMDLLSKKQKALMEVINIYESMSGESTGGGDDAFSDLTAHIIGLGKSEYEQNMMNPQLAIVRGQANDYKESFRYVVPREMDYEKDDEEEGMKVMKEEAETPQMASERNATGEVEDIKEGLRNIKILIKEGIGHLKTPHEKLSDDEIRDALTSFNEAKEKVEDLLR